MGKQTKTKSGKPESYGKGKVTPVQIAFIVDRYLSDNNFSQTRSTFRTEASDLISKSPVQEAPKSLLTLGAILDEYICLKEQKVMLDQDKWRLEHEKIRVHTLLRGMQDVMNVYNAGGSATPPPPPMVSSVAAQSSATVVPQIDLPIKSPAGYPVYNNPIMMPSSRPSNTHMDPSNFSTPITNHPTSKRRKGPKDVPDALVIAKRSRRHLSANRPLVKGTGTCSQSSNAVNNQKNAMQFSAGSSSPHDDVLNGSLVQGSNVAKCLFNQPNQSPPTNFTVPKTPLRANSSADKSSPLETTSTATSGNDVTPREKTSANCFVISSETIRVSPVKQLTYYSIERNHCISSSSPVKTNLKRLSGRDHVKGRLDFDGSDTVKNSWNPIPDGISLSESDKEGDIFDLDLPNLDAFGVDFSLSELLVDFDIGGEFSCPLLMDSSSNSHSGSPNEPWNVDLGTNQVFSELSSTVTEILSEKDTFVQGPESVTSVKSTTKCIKILSPAKNHRSSPSDQQNLSAKSRLV